MQRVLGGRSPGPQGEPRYFWLGMLADDFSCFVKMILVILVLQLVSEPVRTRCQSVFNDRFCQFRIFQGDDFLTEAMVFSVRGSVDSFCLSQ